MIEIEGVLDNIAATVRTTLTDMDENYNVMVSGKPGKGKSGTALTFAKLIDPDFTTKQVVFNNGQLLDLIDSHPKAYWRGRAIVFDEAGIERSAYESQTRINTAMNKVFQSYRYLNICIIYTASYLSFILKNDRKLFHAQIKIHYKDTVKKEVHAKWYYLNWKETVKGGDLFTIFHKMNIDGRTYKIREIRIPHPPLDIWREYQKRERPFKLQVRKDARKVIADAKKPKRRGGQPQTDKKIITKHMKRILKAPEKYKGPRGAFDTNKIAYACDVGIKLAKRIRAAAEMEAGK